MAGFTLALPMAVAAGAPISTALLELNGIWGLAGWKWMFIAEAVPTVLIGYPRPVLLSPTGRPRRAGSAMTSAPGSAPPDRWRAPRDRSPRKVSIVRSFWDPKVLLLALNYFGIVTASLGLLLFLPQIVKQLGFTNMQVGWVTHGPLSLRRAQHGGLGLGVRPHGRAALEPVLGLPARRASASIVAGMTRHLLVARRHVHRDDRALWHQGTVLGDAVDVPHRLGGGIGHRLDQLDRQSRRLLRPDRGRLGQERDRQFRRRPLLLAGFALMSAVSAFWLDIPRSGSSGGRTGGRARGVELSH